jgi:transposase
MKFKVHHTIKELKGLLKKFSSNKVILRIMMIIMKIKNCSLELISKVIGFNQRTVKYWLNRYSENSIKGIIVEHKTGRKSKITDKEKKVLLNEIRASNETSNNNKYTTGNLISEFIQRKLNKYLSRSSTYYLMKKVGLVKLKPRPRHEKNNPKLMNEWLDNFPYKLTEIQNKNPNKNVCIYYQDESRYGQMTIQSGIWSIAGERPEYLNQYNFLNAWIYGAINPQDGKHFGLILPKLDSLNMQIFLDQFSKTIDKKSHVLMILDGSRAHLNNKLIIPKNLTLHFLPPYSPQLNPIERLWSFIKRNYLSFKRYKDIDEVMQSGVEAWKKINQKIIKSICFS